MKIRPIRDQKELDLARDSAQKDGSHLYWPTHIITRGNGDIIGTLSVMPMVIFWSHHCMLTRESIQTRDFIEGLMANQSRVVGIPCPKDSTYFGHMKKYDSGFLDLGEVNLFLKAI